jgi:hypothetical protein
LSATAVDPFRSIRLTVFAVTLLGAALVVFVAVVMASNWVEATFFAG